MRFVLISLALIASAAGQIYTVKGPNGYDYPKPVSRFDMPVKAACENGGIGDNCDVVTLPPLPAFIPQPNFPQIIRVDENPFVAEVMAPAIPEVMVPEVMAPVIPEVMIPAIPEFIAPAIPEVMAPVMTDIRFEPEAPVAVPIVPEIQNKFKETDVELLPAPLPDIPDIPLDAALAPVSENNNGYIPPVAPVAVISESTITGYIPPVAPVKVAIPVPTMPAYIPPQTRFQTQTTTKSPNEYLPPLFMQRFGDDIYADEWELFKQKYEKTYATETEEKLRHGIFDGNLKKIMQHNQNFAAGMVAFDLSVNSFGDLTQDEFVEVHTGIRVRRSSWSEQKSTKNLFMPSNLLEDMVDEEVDWRKKGAVTPVKNQGNCASCWAFSANGALEAQNFLRTGKLVSLSEQNLIDCVTANNGCNGGYMTKAYEYVRDNMGVDTEMSYPYEQTNNTCRYDPANIGGTSMNHMEIMIGSEEALQQAVATVGPVAAGIDGSKHSFQFYKSGYYFEPTCVTEVNHAVLVVGYGKDEQGEYWICKNSWAEDWGEEGYIRMAKNKNNHCGITSLASYPLV